MHQIHDYGCAKSETLNVKMDLRMDISLRAIFNKDLIAKENVKNKKRSGSLEESLTSMINEGSTTRDATTDTIS